MEADGNLLNVCYCTVKFFAEVAAPLGVMTEIGPVVAPAGTVAWIWVELSTVNVAEAPLN
jgi:hypothetical protein